MKIDNKFDYNLASTIKARVTDVAEKVKNYDEVDRVDLSFGKEGEVAISALEMIKQGLKPIQLDSVTYIAGGSVSFNPETKAFNSADVTACTDDNEERYIIRDSGNERIFKEIAYSAQEDSYSVITVSTDKKTGEIIDCTVSCKKED